MTLAQWLAARIQPHCFDGRPHLLAGAVFLGATATFTDVQTSVAWKDYDGTMWYIDVFSDGTAVTWCRDE